jgi:hypothetical protein
MCEASPPRVKGELLHSGKMSPRVVAIHPEPGSPVAKELLRAVERQNAIDVTDLFSQLRDQNAQRNGEKEQKKQEAKERKHRELRGKWLGVWCAIRRKRITNWRQFFTEKREEWEEARKKNRVLKEKARRKAERERKKRERRQEKIVIVPEVHTPEPSKEQQDVPDIAVQEEEEEKIDPELDFVGRKLDECLDHFLMKFEKGIKRVVVLQSRLADESLLSVLTGKKISIRDSKFM